MENISDKSGFPSYWVTIEGLSIHYKCLGQGPSVILIHGGGNDWHEWNQNLAFLSRSFQVYAVDLPGFGMSQPPEAPVSPSWGAVFLINFMKTLEIVKPSLIGHCLGGMIAIDFAANYPESVSKLVLVDAIGFGKLSGKGRLMLSIFRIIDHCQAKKRGPQYIAASIEERQVLDELPQIRCPVLIIWGQNDFYLPVSQCKSAQALIPDSRLSIFPHCGHAPQRESADKFNCLVSEFLAE